MINAIKQKFALTDDEGRVFDEYIKNKFTGEVMPRDGQDYQIAVWEKLTALSQEVGAAEVLNRYLCKNFPVKFKSPEKVSMEIYCALAGHIPVIYVHDKDDFESLVTNIVHKGVRPDNIEQTGASFVSGKNIRFIILSAKPYSNVTADELGLDEADWAEKSMLVRRSHECTHFYTKQRFGIADNDVHNEIMADFIGLYDAFGFYNAGWFLRFMGIIEGSGGRLVVYTNELPENIKAAVAELLTLAAKGLERWSHTDEFKALTKAERIEHMCCLGIADMAEL